MRSLQETSYPSGKVQTLIIFLIVSLFGSANAADKAQPKKGKEFTPPLSERIPESVSTLPSFGHIQWRTTTLPWVGDGPYEGISGAGMVAINNKLYVVGGFIPGGDESGDLVSGRTSRWLWSFDPVSATWTQLPSAPIRREYVRAVSTDTEIFMMGGASQYKGTEPNYRPHNETATLDLSSKPLTWEIVPPLNTARTHMAVGASNDHIVVAGGNEYIRSEIGYSHKTIRDTVEVLDLKHPQNGWQLSAPMPSPARGWSASTFSNNTLFVFGGITWDIKNTIIATQETLSFTTQENKWKKHTPPPIGVSGWEAALFKKRYAMITGGVYRPDPESPMIWSDLTLVYDTQEDQWFQVEGVLPPGAVFNDPGVVIIGDTIYVLGAEGPGGSHYNYFLIGKIQPAKNIE